MNNTAETKITPIPFVEALYLTVTGAIIPELAVPQAENLFADGKPCDKLYEQVQAACHRICRRLSIQAEDDPDLTEILNLTDRICQQVGYEMYRCGATLSSPQDP